MASWRASAGQGDERVVEPGLFDAQLVGHDVVAGENGRDGQDEVAGAGDHDRLAVPSHAPNLGQTGQQPVVDRGGGSESQSLLGVDAGDEAGRRVERHDAAVVDQGDAVGEALGLLHEVGHQDDRHAAVADILDELPGVTPRLRVEAGGQLVEDRDLRVADQRQRDRQPLLLAAGQLAERGLALVGQAEIVEQLVPSRGVG